MKAKISPLFILLFSLALNASNRADFLSFEYALKTLEIDSINRKEVNRQVSNGVKLFENSENRGIVLKELYSYANQHLYDNAIDSILGYEYVNRQEMRKKIDDKMSMFLMENKRGLDKLYLNKSLKISDHFSIDFEPNMPFYSMLSKRISLGYTQRRSPYIKKIFELKTQDSSYIKISDFDEYPLMERALGKILMEMRSQKIRNLLLKIVERQLSLEELEVNQISNYVKQYLNGLVLIRVSYIDVRDALKEGDFFDIRKFTANDFVDTNRIEGVKYAILFPEPISFIKKFDNSTAGNDESLYSSTEYDHYRDLLSNKRRIVLLFDCEPNEGIYVVIEDTKGNYRKMWQYEQIKNGISLPTGIKYKFFLINADGDGVLYKTILSVKSRMYGNQRARSSASDSSGEQKKIKLEKCSKTIISSEIRISCKFN
ncbi:hypothetical protein ABN763_06345 [Spongiivirga sp. MCCC 1A20706]|uniref:hypothetical protein n=1 Tax=Spongiivirga sp. MCCC 1A20706 TaxID=3160963 RepID=UPI003977DBED